MWAKEVESAIVEIHQFFEDWYNGAAEKRAFRANVADHFAHGFKIVMPDGTLYQRGEILPLIEKGFGTSRDFKIEIKMRSSEEIGDSFTLALYEEWHMEEGHERKGRLAVLLLEQVAPGKFLWRHCHETPLPA